MKNGLFTSVWNEKDFEENESSLTAPKAGLHPKKVMLCIWWDWKGIVYYEFLPHNQTINSDKYCSQLDRLKAAIDEKRPELANQKSRFHQDKISRLVAYSAKIDTTWLGCPTSLILFIRSCTFHLFRSLQNSLNGKNFDSLEACKNHLE